MKRNEAIKMMAELVVKHKNEIVDIVNNSNIGSLKYTSDIKDVNKVVVDNLENKDFLDSVDKIVFEKNEFCYEPISLTAIIIASVIVVSTGVLIAHKSSLARKERRNILRENRRTLYLQQEELDEIAFLERQDLYKEFLVAQQDFLQQEENQIQAEREQDRKDILMIVVGGILIVAAASVLMNR